MKPKDLAHPATNIAVLRKLAALSMTGMSPAKMAQHVSLGRSTVNRILASATFEAILNEMSNQTILPILEKIQLGLSDLIPLTMEVLKEQLEKQRSLKAVELVHSGLGVYAKREKESGDTNIQIVLPDGMETFVSPAKKDPHEDDDV